MVQATLPVCPRHEGPFLHQRGARTMTNPWRASRVLMIVVTVLVVAACGPAAQPDTTQTTAAPAAPAAGGQPTAPAAAVAPPAAPGKYVESVFLADRVKAGKLP